MGKWCPKCRAEYVEGWGACSDCGVELVDTLPPEPAQGRRIEPPDASFLEPHRSSEDEDPFTPIWEGPTPEGAALSRHLEAAHIPVDLGEAAEPGRLRIEVPRSYIPEAFGILDVAGEQPLPEPEPEPDFGPQEEHRWPPLVRAVFWLLAIGIIAALLATSRW